MPSSKKYFINPQRGHYSRKLSALFLVLGLLGTMFAVVQYMTHHRQPAYAATINRSGLPWESGAEPTNDSTSFFETFRGRALDVKPTWNDADTWDAIQDIYTVDAFNTPTKFPGKMSFAMPLLDKSKKSSLSACASGSYDTYFKTTAQNLVAKGWPDAYVRLGWEMNGNWYKWSVNGQTANWVNCYKHAHDAMKSAAGNNFLFEWNANKDSSGMGSTSVTAVYPGDDYVDIIGVDFYDQYPAYPDQAAWDADYNATQNGGPRGIGAWLAFAKSHGKKLSVPEWGVHNDPSGGGGFDNPFFIQKMYEFFSVNAADIAYEAYFSAQGCTFELGNGCNPNASAAYQSLWSAPVSTDPSPTPTPAPTPSPTPSPTPAPTPSPTPEPTPGLTLSATVDEKTSTGTNKFSFSNKWTDCGGCDGGIAYKNSYKYTNYKGKSFTFYFTGKQVALTGFKEPGGGLASVSIDGGTSFNIDTYGPDNKPGVIYTSPELTDTAHRITVTNAGLSGLGSGTVISIDKADIYR